MKRVWLALLGSTFFTFASASAQDVVVVRGRDLDRSSPVARRAVGQFNDRNTTRFYGSLMIDDDEAYHSDLGIFEGRLRVFGEVNGDIVAINADVELRRGAVVRGNITVIGGSLTREGGVRLDGDTRLYRARALVRRVGDRLELLRGRTSTARFVNRRRSPSGDVSIVVTTGGTYNRVEGLPLMGGARIDWGDYDRSRFTLEGLGIVRTAGDFENNRQDLGYALRADVTIGRRSYVQAGAKAYDHVVPIESWQMSAAEVGWATLLWHRDYRDYYLSRGLAGFVEFGTDRGVRLRGTLARNEESSIAARNPWTPFRRDSAWRPNPAIDDGTFTSITTEFEYDGRFSDRSTRSAWYLRAEWEHATSDDVTPIGLPPGTRGPFPPGSYQFDRVFVDARRYENIGAGRLHLRAVGAGVVGENPLPVQRRLSLGFPDPMPGFSFRSISCGGTVFGPALPALCDRMMLFQVEYRGDLSFRADRRRDDRRRHREGPIVDVDVDDWFWIEGPTLVLFADAGTAWLKDDGPGDLDADVGAGLEFGSLGVYVARAVTGGDAIRFSLRLKRRF